MAVAQKQEFEDPDELPVPADDTLDDVEVEILDDVPEEDIRTARPAADRVDPDSDDFENEIKDYSENARKRIKAVKFEFHEERRQKETAQRQADEAGRYAESVSRDNAALKKSLQNSNSIMVEQYSARNDAELEKARGEFKEAYEGGETDALLEAQEKLSVLHAERANAPRRAPAPAEQEVMRPAPNNPGTPDPRATRWLRENGWFQGKGTEDMTGYAIGLHQKLISQGYNPQMHEEYYTKIDEGMKAVFPDKFSSADLGGEVDNEPPAVTRKKKAPPVGGPSRGGKTPRKVQLTSTQVSLAKRLGLSNKQYAAQVLKEQKADD